MRLFSTAALLFAALTGVCVSQEVQGVNVVQLIELLEANAAAIATYDVVVTQNQFAIKNEIGQDTAAISRRIIVDTINEKAAQYSSGHMTTCLFDRDGKVKMQDGALLNVALVDRGSSVMRNFEHGINLSREHKNFGAALDECDFLNLDFVGFTEFPIRPFPLVSPTKATNPREEPGLVWSYVRPKWVSAEASIESRDPAFTQKQSPGVNTRIVFDRKTLLPIKRSVNRDDGEGLYVEFYKWQQVEGVSLPKELYRDRRRTIKLPDGTRQEYEENLIYEFEWKTVNKPIDPKLFNQSAVTDPQIIRDLIAMDEPRSGTDSRSHNARAVKPK